MKIIKLDERFETKYDTFVRRNPENLLYYSNKYRILLKEFLKAEDHYFIAIDTDDEILGVLPSFIKRNLELGNVLNSLPFYGSNGGIVEYNENYEAKRSLLSAFYEYAKENGCVSATLITSPFEKDASFIEKYGEYRFVDERIGQVTRLPDAGEDIEDIKNRLIEMYHGKTRNIIRKALKSDIDVKVENNEKALDFLVETHMENMESIHGIPKPKSFFEIIPKVFDPGSEYRIYMAYTSGKPIAAMLVFLFNKTVEYFTPVVVREYRSLQPLSLLIYKAMQDSVSMKYKWWNWGGTWLTQDGVYHFKKRWNTCDFPYRYYISVFDEMVLTRTKETLLKEYPYFYVVPFGVLLQK